MMLPVNNKILFMPSNPESSIQDYFFLLSKTIQMNDKIKSILAFIVTVFFLSIIGKTFSVKFIETCKQCQSIDDVFFAFIYFLIALSMLIIIVIATTDLIENLTESSIETPKKIIIFIKAIIKGLMIIITSPFFLFGVIYEYIQLSFDTGRRSTKAIDDYLLNNKKDNE